MGMFSLHCQCVPVVGNLHFLLKSKQTSNAGIREFAPNVHHHAFQQAVTSDTVRNTDFPDSIRCKPLFAQKDPSCTVRPEH